MPQIDVPGATLHYETQGQGPLLLCISGANGDLEIWQPLASQLSSHFTVVSYDRRGFSRSFLSGAQDYSVRLATDADDAAALIKHLTPGEPATVLGSSSGAIVALTLLLRHHDLIRMLLCHEPPAFKLQAGTDQLFAEQSAIYDTYRARGIPPAIEQFAAMIKADPEELPVLLHVFDARSKRHAANNSMYWFEREMKVYPMADLSSEAFRPFKEKLFLANGELSKPESLQCRANMTLGEELQLALIILPGAHVGYATHAEKFAKELLGALAKRDKFYSQL